ncbi:threonine/serine exporter family protein [uncultured Clostridium sp.]|uniref:threonine/serine exporter family protein n=1 Tax=uncultured Clostridium sp. TaxID=59620 RepID=UPI00262ADAB2|nr:threonine/serine exporter family protein [uncultured Clostridium sp.]
MNVDKILHVSTYAGKILLESGAETYRIEETIVRICKSFGVDFAESYVTPTGIMVSIYDQEKNTKTLVTRVKNRSNNLQKIHLVNNLSRELAINSYTVSEVDELLKEIDHSKVYSNGVTLLSSGFAAAFLTILFGGRLLDCIVCFFIGICIRLMAVAADKLLINSFFVNALGGALAAGSAIFFYKIGLDININHVIIGSIMLLVPGLTITNAIRDTIAGDLLSGLTRAAEAVFIAISIAIGTGAVMTIWVNHLGGSF